MSETWSPDDLSEMLKRGEITKEEAVELLDRQAREKAFAEMSEAYTQKAEGDRARVQVRGGRREDSQGRSRRMMNATLALIVLMAGMLIVMWMVLRHLAQAAR
ncbi:MAG: hypothetical protein BWZ02_02685 [Lentisphaerae bacterium ADurb.BinA184]|nr:MAG: hypothetical protein BWZ02_02685 [Lentisphaerae bacterium ADurb.BinA184]